MKSLIHGVIISLCILFHSIGIFAQSGTIEGNTTPCALGTYQYTLVTEQFPISVWWSVSSDPDGLSSSSAAYLINPGGMETDLEIVADESFYLVVNYSLFEFGWEVYYSARVYVQVTSPQNLDLQLIGHTLDHVAIFMDANPNHSGNNDITYAWSAPSGWNAAAPVDEHIISYHSNDNAGDIIATAANACGISEPDTISTGTPNCTLPILSQTIQESSPWSGSYCGQLFDASIQTIIQLPNSFDQYMLTNLGDQSVNWILPAGINSVSALDSSLITLVAQQSGNIQVSILSACGNETLSNYHSVFPYVSGYVVWSDAGFNSQSVIYAQEGDVMTFYAVDSSYIEQYADSIVWHVPNNCTLLSGDGTSEITVMAGAQSDSIHYTVYFPCNTTFNSTDYHIQIATNPCAKTELDYYDFEVGDVFHFLIDSTFYQLGVMDTAFTRYEVNRITNKIVSGNSVTYEIHARYFVFSNGNWTENPDSVITRTYYNNTPSPGNEFSCGIQVYPTMCALDTATRFLFAWSYTTPSGFVTNFGQESYDYAPGLGMLRYAKESHSPNTPMSVYLTRQLVYWQRLGDEPCGEAAFPEALAITAAKEPSSRLLIYPNPSEGHIRVEWPLDMEVNSIEVYNQLGQSITHIDYPTSRNLHITQTGLYWVRVITPVETFISPVLVH
jgi:hypothetical protein